MPADAKEAVLRATEIWSDILQTDVTLQLRIDWYAFNGDDVLATNGATYFKRGQEDINTRKDAFYTAPLAEHLGIRAEYDYTRLNVRINSVYEATGAWHYDPYTRPDSDQYDLTQAILKEIGRTVGLTSSVQRFTRKYEVKYGLGSSSNPAPTIYDYYVKDETGIALTDFPMLTYSEDLYDYTTSGAVRWQGPNVDAALHSEDPFDMDLAYAKNITCLDQGTYAESGESLMKAYQQRGEQIHNVGPMTREMLRVIGWEVARGDGPGEYESDAEHLPSPFTHGGGFTAYPNPTTDQLYVNWDNMGAEGTVISIVHMQTQRRVYHAYRERGVSTAVYDLSDEASGYYQVLVSTDEGVVLQQSTVYRQ